MSRLLRTGIGAAAVGLLLMYNSVDTTPKANSASGVIRPPAIVAPATPRPSPPATTPADAPTDAPTDAPAEAPAEAAQDPAPAPPSLGRANPTRLRIPQIGVDAPFTELTLDPEGQLTAPPPDDDNLVGWYRDGVSPGELGSSVVAGHVDTTTGPAVFVMLSQLQPDQQIEVGRADGTVAVFSVDSVEAFPKNAFPDDKVYGQTPDAQLRLITCGGTYDKGQKDYSDNVVVFAHLDSSHPA
ncbi:class F sortase [Kitasatospora sp. NPDC059812]|uniref:class F sortase n=1 Tax=Kitasatospora sp. NPDC059812 TaxID=3346958 RepID=UPI00366260C0